MFDFFRLTALFAITALAEIIGCYLPWLVLTQGRQRWLLLPAAAALAVSPGCSLCTQALLAAPMLPMAVSTSWWPLSGCGASWMGSCRPAGM